MSQILESLENAKQERENRPENSQSPEGYDGVDPFETKSGSTRSRFLSPVAWLIVLFGLVVGALFAAQYGLDGVEPLGLIQQYLSKLF